MTTPTLSQSKEVETQMPLDWSKRLKSASWVMMNHVARHTGAGIVVAVAYFDPGNWGVDLQAGSQYGYKLLFIVLLSGLFAVFFQALASRLGCVTGLDLAAHCRLLLYNRSNHPRVIRWTMLYPLYVLSEIAVIATDLAELLGSAIALCMLFPSLPLWGGVLLTASDVLLLLAIGDPLRGRPAKLFESVIAILVLAVLVSMSIIISKISINWGDAFDGFIPSKPVFQSGGLYTSIGIIGATCMPHSIFLGSFLSTQDRTTSVKIDLPSTFSNSSISLETSASSPPQPRHVAPSLRRYFINMFRPTQSERVFDDVKCHAERENNSLSFIRRHLYHGYVDLVVSLLGVAVVINAFILILASAVFYYGDGENPSVVPASLFDAHDLIGTWVSKPAAVLFALALLCAGQSSSIIATVAGQVICEGFIHWKISPVLRRLFTRTLGLIPSVVVAVAAGRPGIDTLLVASQVVLSIVLPFIVFPLVFLTSSKSIMSVKKPIDITDSAPVDLPAQNESAEIVPTVAEASVEVVSFANNVFTKWLGYLVWLVILVANVYVIVTLALGEDS
ncbi:hypothetical protein JAAARDRAFT_28865 [Jaapia argillacea MUCL 33604]|uniref:Natural resistance-associated macrophage protein n=1 Tax=Jaapia argillacea MUCL 33604 TaxID=933084 RepID=A0A067Q7D6_9AGAM|nr:hypothetical protein JAAARDRAFT_28865 [Jaapia argillacea MUCL 33604]